MEIRKKVAVVGLSSTNPEQNNSICTIVLPIFVPTAVVLLPLTISLPSVNETLVFLYPYF